MTLFKIGPASTASADEELKMVRNGAWYPWQAWFSRARRQSRHKHSCQNKIASRRLPIWQASYPIEEPWTGDVWEGTGGVLIPHAKKIVTTWVCGASALIAGTEMVENW
ncbi:Hypothetical predicted protein [Lecanosticta acicola]|uniref:Uncharacterized protein n=1 Tax=Lecanosticta acicola TaxID=111012 RepID=A0AAI9EAC8_9PEZI|nr:Hypothetical predicted protein [Lecanosticta acicola]